MTLEELVGFVLALSAGVLLGYAILVADLVLELVLWRLEQLRDRWHRWRTRHARARANAAFRGAYRRLIDR